MSKLEIQLLGRLSIAAENVGEFALPRKNKVMLAALALAGPGGLSREKLVDLLWGDRDDKRAHASLRQALAATRKALGPYRDCLRAEPEQIRIDGAMTELDTRDFEALASSEVPGDRDRALALYQGDLLDGIRLKEEAFEAWSRPLRERLRTKAITLLSESLNSACDAERCVALASRLLELEATNEAAHRALMRTYAAQGRDNAAFKQFIVCRDLLDHELGIGPSRQTIALVEEIRGKRRLLAGRKRSGGARTAVVEPKATTVERPHSTTNPTITVPDKPSLAVLPFTNMSGDPEQEYFSDGISEDIITELSRFRSLFVIARNSSFTFKGRAVDVTEVGRTLGVRYVVEGSVRKAGKRVRVTAQLVEATTGNHLWTERYDRDLEDIFAVQDEVTHAIVTAIEPTLGSAERERAHRKPTESLDAWESYQRGLWNVYRFAAQENTEAQSFFRRAIELDPNFAPAHAGLAYAIYLSVMLGFRTDRAPDLGEARAAAQRAVTLDGDDALAHAVVGRVHIMVGEDDAAISSCETALALNPNLATARFGLGWALTNSGRYEEGIVELDKAIRLNPRDPMLWAFLVIKAKAYLLTERYEEGLETTRAAQRQPNAGVWAHIAEVVALAQLDRIEEAKLALEHVYAIKPDFDIKFMHETMVMRNPAVDEVYLGGLKKAGLEE